MTYEEDLTPKLDYGYSFFMILTFRSEFHFPYLYNRVRIYVLFLAKLIVFYVFFN